MATVFFQSPRRIYFPFSPHLVVCVDVIRPLHVWTFDEGLADWVNDANNWNHKWRADQKQLCLRVQAVKEATTSSDLSPWASSARSKPRPDRRLSVDYIQARLWSSLVPADVKMHCITMAFEFYLGRSSNSQPRSKSLSLTLLQRQER